MKKITLLLTLIASFLLLPLEKAGMGLFAQVYNFTVSTHATGLFNPVSIAQAPGDDRLYIVEQDGAIRIVNTDGSLVAGDWLNITARVYDNGNEQGLLGLAFDPDYQTNGYFYVNYTIDSTGTSIDGDTRVSRFSRSIGNPLIADPATEVILLRIDQPYTNHNGGCIKFGPDGYLYIGMGDGGSSGDPGNRSQNIALTLGKMLRINVDAPTYTSPVSNPFYGIGGYAPQIWALGIRNPWKFSFDRITGDMWIGDVGQNAHEEIDHQLASSPGGENYGWRCYEGAFAYNTAGCLPIGSYDFPKADIPQATGPMCSVTAGEVYRGAKFGALYDKLLFTDYCNDYIWTLTYDTAGAGTYDTTRHNGFGGSYFFVAMNQDNRGDIFLSEIFSGTIYKLDVDICTPAAIIESPLNQMVTCDGGAITLNSAPGIGLNYQWLLSGVPIGGATDSTYITSTAGDYQLIVTNASCGVNPSDTSTIYVLGSSTTPAVSLSAASDTTCLSFSTITLTGTPVGGEYFSPYVNAAGTFYPQVAGVGSHQIVYQYQNVGGCNGYDTLVMIVNSGCLGLDELSFNDIVLFPNPADEQVTLSISSNINTQFNLNIMTVDGKLVQQSTVQIAQGNNNFIINTSTFSSGVYFVQMRDGIHSFTRKIVIQ